MQHRRDGPPSRQDLGYATELERRRPTIPPGMGTAATDTIPHFLSFRGRQRLHRLCSTRLRTSALHIFLQFDIH
ncbi:MAG: hypothetical protein LC808_12425 [Actinobacteria bacterium]|nr:hypothetical protein [Actinomycetota bacterium]